MGDQLESAEVTKISTNQVYLKISQEMVTLTSPDVQFLRLGVSHSTSPGGGAQGGVEADSERKWERDKSRRKDSLGRGGGKNRRGGSWSKGGSKGNGKSHRSTSSSKRGQSSRGNSSGTGSGKDSRKDSSGKGSTRLQAKGRSSYFSGSK